MIGLNRAGKSTYLAQALKEATSHRSLAPVGISRFAATPETAPVLHKNYFLRFHRRREIFDPTNKDEAPARLMFTLATDNTNKGTLLVTYDLSGEALMDHNHRVGQLPFMRKSDALIVLIDPTDFDAARPHLPPHLVGADRDLDQASLIRGCLDEIEDHHARQVPVVVVISKSDLLVKYLGLSGTWAKPSTATDFDGWRAEAHAISGEIKELLEQLGETQIIDILEDLPVFYTAVSALGDEPAPGGTTRSDGATSGGLASSGYLAAPYDEEGTDPARYGAATVPDVEPLRCSDPLALALYALTRT